MSWRQLIWPTSARNISPGRRERAQLDWQQRIRRQLATPKVVAVISPKGGVGKSTTALELGHVLARLRGDLVVALDASPGSGSLVKRLPRPHSRYHAGHLRADSAQISRFSEILPYVTQADSGLYALSSNQNPDRHLGPADYLDVLDALTRFYSLVLVDTGASIHEPAARAIIHAADVLVAVTDTTFEATEVVLDGLGWLRTQEHLPRITAVINAVRPGTCGGCSRQLAADLGQQADHVVLVPHDPHLTAGRTAQRQLLGRQARDAYLNLAATVIDEAARGEAGGRRTIRY